MKSEFPRPFCAMRPHCVQSVLCLENSLRQHQAQGSCWIVRPSIFRSLDCEFTRICNTSQLLDYQAVKVFILIFLIFVIFVFPVNSKKLPTKKHGRKGGCFGTRYFSNDLYGQNRCLAGHNHFTVYLNSPS